jgi:hypothetical protein
MVEKIRFEHTNRELVPREFELKAQSHYANAKWPVPERMLVAGETSRTEQVHMKFWQFPIVRNTCTTGHKLQGKTVTQIFIYNWGYKCTNWPYVVLSRVTEMKGVFLKTPLKRELNQYAVPPDLVRMMDKFKLKEAQYYDDDYYDNIIG